MNMGQSPNLSTAHSTTPAFWQSFAEGQHHLPAAEIGFVLINPNRDSKLRVQFEHRSQMMSVDQYLFVPKGRPLSIFCGEAVELFCVPVASFSSAANEIALIADAILAHSAEIYQLNLRFGALNELQNAWEQLVLARVRQLSIQRPAAENENALSKLNRFIDSKLAHPLTVDDLAQHLGMVKTQFLRWSKTQLNCTPCQYVIQRRLHHAKLLLCNSDTAIVDIALQTGFASQAHFANTFKSAASITPGAYRKMHGSAALWQVA